MKLQVSFDITDLPRALSIAKEINELCDIIEIGTPLIYQYGINAVEQFREQFPDIQLLADAKIVDRGKQEVTLFAKAGANFITVMAGTTKNVIHSACLTADNLGVKIVMDLLDAPSIGQSAMEAKTLGVSALHFHQPHDDENSLMLLDRWNMIRENTDLPIFISAHINRTNIEEIRTVQPDGLVIGKSIVEAKDPKAEALFFHEICTTRRIVMEE